MPSTKQQVEAEVEGVNFSSGPFSDFLDALGNKL